VPPKPEAADWIVMRDCTGSHFTLSPWKRGRVCAVVAAELGSSVILPVSKVYQSDNNLRPLLSCAAECSQHRSVKRTQWSPATGTDWSLK
jgi:hypothetical protein